MSIRDLLHLYEYNNNLNKSLEEINHMQNKKFIKIINSSYNNINYYNKNFKDKFSNIKSITDIAKLPLLSKEILRNLPLEDILNRQVDKNKLICRQTSGSTGIPLTVYTDKDGASIDYVIWRRSNMKRGVTLRDKFVTLITPRDMHPDNSILINVAKKLKLINRYYLSILEDPNTLLNSLTAIKPDVIKSYPSCLKILADMYSKDFNGKINPKIIITSGELLENSVRKQISDTFRSEVYDNYSSEELGQVAWECKEHKGYHINTDNIYIELINKNDEVIGNNEVGEIVCTTLNNFSMPLIRYRMKDMAILLEEKCSCGIKLPLFKMIEGRSDDFLENETGKLISPRLLSDILEEPFNNYEGINQYQIIQEKINQLYINLEITQGTLNEEKLEEAKRIIKNVFENDVEITFKYVDNIEKDKSGKLRKIINKLH
jgi:phenylacetate-CoA ligase